MLRLRNTKFRRTINHLNALDDANFMSILHRAGVEGVNALSAATPVDTSETARSWSYEVKSSRGVYRLSWSNSVMAGDVPLVILLQYGHGTRGGTFVTGRDFINPALKPVYENLRSSLAAEVMR